MLLPDLPSAERVAKRLLVLRHLYVTSFMTPPQDLLETWKAQMPREEFEKFKVGVQKENDEWWQPFRDSELWAELSPWEIRFAETPIGEMTLRQLTNAFWRLESAQTLMWCLNQLPAIPPYDQAADPDLLKTDFLKDRKRLISTANLRPREEIEKAREIAELWHWRSRTRELMVSEKPFPVNSTFEAGGIRSYEDVVRQSANRALKDGFLAETISEDFPARGKAFRDLTEDEWSQVRSITVERHFALNWVCGYAPNNEWDSTPTDT